MSFWNGIKQVFGFSHEDEEDEEEYSSASPVYAVTTTSPESADTGDRPTDPQEMTTTAEDETAQDDEMLPADLFDAVIEFFNETQPDFVRNCLSLESQRAYLIGTISESLRKRVSVSAVISASADAADNASLRNENGKLRKSLDTQKRALLDRINDLETQVARLHDDKDRFFTGKRSIADEEEIAKGLERIASLESEVADLTDQLQKARAAQSDGADTERIASLEQELARQTTLREQLELKSRMGDEMLSNIRNEAAKLRRELEEVSEEREEAARLLAEQLDGFEILKNKYETRISELQEQLDAVRREDHEARISKLMEENASLRHTIENNLYNQANNEMRLRKEIKELAGRLQEFELSKSQNAPSADTPASPSPVTSSDTPPTPPRKRGRPKKVRIDSDLDNTDWFAQSGGKKEDPDFGYHEPPRKPVNDNEAQLTLF